MAFTLESISNAMRLRAPRIVLLGTSGIGKSEFAAGSDNPIFLPIKGEEGIDGLSVQAFPVVQTFQDVMEAMKTLCSEEHSFRTVVIDSASTLAPLVVARAMQIEDVKSSAKLGGGYGHQWDTIRNLWCNLRDCLDILRNNRDMTSIVIGHVSARSSHKPGLEGYEAWEFNVEKRVGGDLIAWADIVLFMGRKYIVTKSEGGWGKKEKQGDEVFDGKRYLWTDETAVSPGKRRGLYGDLPTEIALPKENAWATFKKIIADKFPTPTPQEGEKHE